MKNLLKNKLFQQSQEMEVFGMLKLFLDMITDMETERAYLVQMEWNQNEQIR